MKYLSSLILLFVSPLSLASGGPAPVPSLQEVVDLQFACNVQGTRQLGWAKNAGLGPLYPKGWAIVSDLKIQELPNHGKLPQVRRFEVTFKGWDMMYCRNGIDKAPVTGHPSLEDTIIELSNDVPSDPGLYLNVDNPAEKLTGHFLYTDTGGDEAGDDPGALTCLVDKDQFLQGKARINLEQLCAGASPADRQSTERHIQKLKKTLR